MISSEAECGSRLGEALPRADKEECYHKLCTSICMSVCLSRLDGVGGSVDTEIKHPI